jgi:Ca2+-binding EF-hand superfamily protein
MAYCFLLRWLCRVNRALQYTYPPDFRRRYGREIEQVFGDRLRSVAQTRGLGGLIRLGAHMGADWLITTIREGVASMHVPAQVTGFRDPVFDRVPVFYTCGSSLPPTGALINGGVLSIAVFSAVIFLIGYGGSHRKLLIGSHHPSRSHLLPARTSEVPKDLTAEIKANPYPDEVPINPYFRLILVLGALDTDHDNVISASEIANAPAALKKLDNNHDGKLTAEECGLRFPARLQADPQFVTRARFRFMRIHPVLAALDADHDGEISMSEIKNAPVKLRTLDTNGDGRLTVDEVLPDPATSWVAQLMSVFDKNGDGRISEDERSNEPGRRFRALLDRADRNKDGVVTEEELTDAVRSESVARGHQQ